MSATHPAFAFRSWVRTAGVPYSILAAKASLDELVPELKGLLQIQNHQPNLPLTGKLSNLQGVPAVKFKDNPWSVVYWSIGRAPLLQDDCRTLSGKLGTQAIHLTEKDTSGWVEWFLYQEREELEASQWMQHDDSVYFRSLLRRQVKFKQSKPAEIRAALDRAVDDLLSEQGIEIPGLDLDLAAANVERVDLLTLPEFPLGMKEFQTWIYQGQPEYAIFAVKAPIEQVGQILMERSHAKEWRQRIQSDQDIWAVLSQDNAYWIPMLQPTANPWTVVYWMCGDWVDIADLCQEVSSTLQTRVITLAEEDTSGAVGYEIYAQGKEIEAAGGCPGEEFCFESEIREEPEFDNFDEEEDETINQFIHETFIEEGVYIPCWDLKVSDPYLERVDLLLLSNTGH